MEGPNPGKVDVGSKKQRHESAAKSAHGEFS